MKVLQGLEALDPPLKQVVLTIGNFDGFHRAHQRLLARARTLAGEGGHPLVVLTFEPHPLTIVAPDKAPARLATSDEKLRLLADAGADITVVARSEPKLLSQTAEQFVEDVLIRLFQPTHIVEGPSFGFGRGREGTPELLRRVASTFGVEVEIVEPVTLTLRDDEILMVSSSLIRSLIVNGRVDEASRCLARAYAVDGIVIEGDRRGRTIGFPTANLGDVQQLLPGDGVYAGRAMVDDRSCPAAISIGCTPTFGEGNRQLEAHLLDFDDDIYGRSIRLEFDRRLRDQCAFASAAELTEQLRRDVEAVRTGADSSAVCKAGGKTRTS